LELQNVQLVLSELPKGRNGDFFFFLSSETYQAFGSIKAETQGCSSIRPEIATGTGVPFVLGRRLTRKKHFEPLHLISKLSKL
jgi:hypothetical protein